MILSPPFLSNLLVMETFSRLRGVEKLLETMCKGVPIVEETKLRELEEQSLREGWERHLHFAMRSNIEGDFRIWIETFTSYSTIILLYSTLETQFNGLARELNVRPGKYIDETAVNLRRAISVDVTTDAAWSQLIDLRKLRNIIVHSGGVRDESNRGKIDALVNNYSPRLRTRSPASEEYLSGQPDELVWVSVDLCQDFAKAIDGFFERVFKASRLPNRHCQLEG